MFDDVVRDIASIRLLRWGRVVPAEGAVPWLVVDPDSVPVEPIRRYLVDFIARDNRPGSVRSYAYALLRWWRWLRAVGVEWNQATPAEARDLVLWLKQAAKFRQSKRTKSAATAGTINPVTRKRHLNDQYTPNTIRHSNAVVRAFYEFWIEAGGGPLINPVQLARRGQRANAHHNPLEPFRAEGRLRYNPRVPKAKPREMPEQRWRDLFAALGSNRDRAILAIAVSNGARASELLGVRSADLDWGDQLVRVVRKGSQAQRHETTSFVSLAWKLLRGIADLGEYHSLKDALRYGQRPTAELVDAHRIQCKPVRDMLVRYFEERRPSLDYSSLTGLVQTLAGTFWSDIERHHPGIGTLRLPADVATAWKQRVRFVTSRDGTTRPRKNHLGILVTVRGFYLDLQEWALEDPSWAQWAVSSPVSKAETAGHMKARRKTEAEMHQRVRDRLPRLPSLVDTAERHKAQQAALLEAASPIAFGQTFTHEGREYRRAAPSCYGTARYYWGENTAPVLVEYMATGEQANVTDSEDEAFWAWAVIEVLRHTGVRVEELLEITHLALVSYKLPDTGEIVPMLQIVPSKANQERLLLVGPELASVLASMVTRLRKQNGGSIPLTPRYDKNERLTGPPLPHLFQRRKGWEWAVPAATTVQALLTRTLERTGLRDAAGQPLHYTPHDFRRMFATEAVTGGLPVHIVARLLGHANINTTQAYMAVFDEDLVRSYRSFLGRRRGLRPEAEYREPTEEEWREFQQHFQARKLELGECGRAYGTPCKHEHACLRCPSLRLDPRARPRLVEIIANLNDRIQEAKLNGWLGEVEGLRTSRDAAARKLVSLDRMRERQPTLPPGAIGLPVIVESR